jgi:hypothetical protein
MGTPQSAVHSPHANRESIFLISLEFLDLRQFTGPVNRYWYRKCLRLL